MRTLLVAVLAALLLSATILAAVGPAAAAGELEVADLPTQITS